MRQVLSSFVHAFSMYSKIPMPRASWKKEDMKYAMCFFPLIGLVIGAVMYGVYYFLLRIACGDIIKASILSVIPILITGGIHMDGWLDTMDARNSYKEKEAKLEILKDPHVGAFAVIKCMVYAIIFFGFTSEISNRSIKIIAISYVLSRALSGLGVVYFKGAKKEGLLATFSDSAEKTRVRIVLILYVIACAVIMPWIDLPMGILCFLMSGIVFLYYRIMSYKEFGGITGDLAGYFLQVCELVVLITAVVVDYLF